MWKINKQKNKSSLAAFPVNVFDDWGPNDGLLFQVEGWNREPGFLWVGSF